MEETQADAIAEAMLTPGISAQEELQRKRAAEAALLAHKRRVAWLAIAGFALGAAVAMYLGKRAPLGGLWGGVVASIIGWFLPRRAAA